MDDSDMKRGEWQCQKNIDLIFSFYYLLFVVSFSPKLKKQRQICISRRDYSLNRRDFYIICWIHPNFICLRVIRYHSFLQENAALIKVFIWIQCIIVFPIRLVYNFVSAFSINHLVPEACGLRIQGCYLSKVFHFNTSLFQTWPLRLNIKPIQAWCFHPIILKVVFCWNRSNVIFLLRWTT